MNTISSIRLLISVLIIALVILSCQSPIQTPPEVNRNVIVRVVDSSNVPMPSIPVEVRRTSDNNSNPLTSSVTDMNGATAFVLSIPQNGNAFTFIVGSAQTGKISSTANLLCRDTILVFVLGSIKIPCGVVLNDTIKFSNVCARTSSGIEFPDSIQKQYCSSCDVPLTINYQPLNTSDKLLLKIFDQNGNAVNTSNFILPPRGCFSVRMIYTPQQVGLLNQNITISGTGAGNASLTLNLAIVGNAVPCNQCVCGDSVTVIDLGNVVVSPPDSSLRVSRAVNMNKTQCTREDRLTKNFLASSAFKLENNVLFIIRPNESQPVQIKFTPDRVGAFLDTLIYDTRFRETGLSCRHFVIVRGNGVQAACCLDLVNTNSGYVVTNMTPRIDTLHLSTRIYQSVEGDICFRNCGTGGTAVVSQQLSTPIVKGFSASPQRLDLKINSGAECFTIHFDADTSVVRPNGLGGPAKIRHETDLNIFGCTPQRVHIVVDIDTLPVQFSNCVYRWSQNGMNGYNFTPPEIKGSDVFDPNGDNVNMITDFTLMNIGLGTADVRVKSGWTLIRTGVTDQADFTYAKVKQWANFSTIKQGPFSSQQDFTMTLFSVYSIRVQRGTFMMYALIRIREISTDGQKDKICFDVLFPM